MRNNSTGVVVVLTPDDEYKRLRPMAEDHHLTVAHLGKVGDEDLSEAALAKFWANLQKLWWGNPIKASVNAETVFSTPDGWAFVDLINAPFLPDFRAIVQELLDVHGLPLSRDYGLLPHITKRYVKSNTPQEMVHRKVNIPFSFPRMGLWIGPERWEVDLT